jgi:hypothetical protein
MWEKNGSRDAFRFFIHEATGGSDHIVFNNASVGVPGIEFFTWPDQWYHADTDTPDKGDPTEMKRVAFLGASTAWASANLTDAMLPTLLDVVSDFGYARVAERGIPRALEVLDEAVSVNPSGAGTGGGAVAEPAPETVARAWYGLAAATKRELDAVASIRDIYSGSARATELVDARMAEWEAYGSSLGDYLLKAAEARGLDGAVLPTPTTEESRYLQVVPRLAPGIRAVETSLNGYPPMRAYLQEHPDALEMTGLSRGLQSQVQSFINGERSVTSILFWVRGVTGEMVSLDQVLGFLGILEEVGWIEMTGAPGD